MTGDGGGADVEYRCATEPESALLEYREWVALLAEGDDLGDFGLTPGWLEWAAQEGLVHGLVLDRWKIGDLRKLLDDPDVQTVHLADVAFDLGPE